MAGKPNKGRNKKGSNSAPSTTANPSNVPVSVDATINDDVALIPANNSKADAAPIPANISKADAMPVPDNTSEADAAPISANNSNADENGIAAAKESDGSKSDKEAENSSSADQLKQVGDGVVVAKESDGAQSEAKETENSSSANQSKQGEILLFPVSVKTLGGEKLELQLNPGDSVMDVRQFLLDAPETCFFTCYDLLLHTKDGSTHHLDDYNEISEVADITTGDCSLEMIPALYDDRSIRAHVHRTRELLSLSTLHASLSTFLTLQHENGRSTNENLIDSTRIEVAELDGLGLMQDVSGSLNNLLAPSLKATKCIESITFSSFNPPPGYRRLVGDLIYLDVTTLENVKFCITGTTRMFYVNSSTKSTLNPEPKSGKAVYEDITLLGLLQKLSAKFRKAFGEILERKASAHPFENVQSTLPPNSWLGLYPVPNHERDAARAENALTLTYGNEPIGMQRDWNEELQSCREFPHTSPQERVMRDRALFKVTSDFVDAAVNGAIGVISRCIPPINPTDPECFHMYVHNNIFFSFAVDADMEQLSRKHVPDLSSKSLVTDSSCTSTETLEKSKDGAVENTSVTDTNGPNSNDNNAEAGLPSDLSAEMQLADSEQATYASANNDLKGTKAFQEADVPGLYNLAMAIIDYRGHRVVAQSVLPGILQGDKSDSLLYGSVDNGKKICWNEEFHSKVLEAAKRLHLKEHTVLDGSGNVFKLAAPVECKGIVGSDDRHYLLDLMRVTPRDANCTGPGSRFCILRPELITAFCQAEAAEKTEDAAKSEEQIATTAEAPENSSADIQEQVNVDSNGTSDSQKTTSGEEKTVDHSVSTALGSSESNKEICFNPNVFTEFKLAGMPEEIAADEDSVRKAGLYLTNVVLQKFIQDLCTLEVSPMDGQTLTDALHARGINVRYIGKVAEGTKHLPHFFDLCTNEIAVRAAKHIFKDILRETEDHDIGPAIAHLLNCFFGNCRAAQGSGSAGGKQSSSLKKEQVANQTSGKASKGKSRCKAGASPKRSFSCKDMSSEGLWSDILEFSKTKYQFELPEDARLRVKKVPVIRNLCKKVGVQIAARKYDLTGATPFQMADIYDLQPVVKHSIPLCSEAKDLVETGKIQLAEGMLGEAHTLFSEAFTILQQVCGPMHREVANCCRYLAMVLYHAGDLGGAIMQQHKELIINERCLGLDHPDTAHSYGNMALFFHGLNQTELALRHMSRALLLLSLSCGPEHPDVAATFINIAMMYQDIGKMDTALRYLQEALKKNERLLGEEHVQTAVCYHALAIAFNCMGAYKLSLQHEKKTYDILVKQLGEEDSRTRDSQTWMNTFKMREDQVKEQKQKGAASAQTLNIWKALAAIGESGISGTSVNNPLNAPAVPGPRGRRVDERAARAAAEVRKKAAAKGIVVRPHDASRDVLPGFLKIIQARNEATTSRVTESRGDDTEAKTRADQQSEAPVGLGKGLASLDSKKQKTKSKPEV